MASVYETGLVDWPSAGTITLVDLRCKIDHAISSSVCVCVELSFR